MLSQPCILGINHTWSWWVKFLYIVGLVLVIFCNRFLYLYSWGTDSGLEFSYHVISAGFGISIMLYVLFKI